MYQVELTKTARKAYLKLADPIRKAVYAKLMQLANNPFAPNHNVKPLVGMKDCYRLRIGDWRVVYRLDNDALVITVIKIAHRKEVYR